ncbi:MAG: hypothetical protein ABIK47_04825 [candidate division WOR-3 bacterium]
MANNSTYGVLNTKNFQQLLDDCAINNSFKAEVISLLRVSVPTFFTTYFDLLPAVVEHITGVTGSDIWGNALATALERNYVCKADIADPSKGGISS